MHSFAAPSADPQSIKQCCSNTFSPNPCLKFSIKPPRACDQPKTLPQASFAHPQIHAQPVQIFPNCHELLQERQPHLGRYVVPPLLKLVVLNIHGKTKGKGSLSHK
eukprot:c5097_g1_i1 orf=533-850(+)